MPDTTREVGAWLARVGAVRLGEEPWLDLDAAPDPDALEPFDAPDIRDGLTVWPQHYVLALPEGATAFTLPNVTAGDWVARWYDLGGARARDAEDAEWLDGGDVPFDVPASLVGRVFVHLRRLGR